MVLLVPPPTATEIDGIRRALGDHFLGHVDPHITLIPPVNLPEAEVDAVLAMVGEVASAVAPFQVRLGPVATFAPVTPVAYLTVDAPEADLARLADLHRALRAGRLDRPDTFPYTPHCTVAGELSDDRLAAVVDLMAEVSFPVSFDRVHVLEEQQPGRVWRPIHDVPLGAEPAVIGRGGLELTLEVGERAEPVDAQPFTIVARRQGERVGRAWGWVLGDDAELAELVVEEAHRRTGIGRHLLAAVEHEARVRGASRIGATARDLSSRQLLLGAGWNTGIDDRWVRDLSG